MFELKEFKRREMKMKRRGRTGGGGEASKGNNKARRRRIRRASVTMDGDSPAFDPDLIHVIFKQVWAKRALERERNQNQDNIEGPLFPTCKKNRPSSANSNALRLSSELVRLFISEAVQRAATIAEAEGVSRIEPSHLERILPQLLLDF